MKKRYPKETLRIVIGKINLYFTYSFLVFQSGKWNTKRNMREKE